MPPTTLTDVRVHLIGACALFAIGCGSASIVHGSTSYDMAPGGGGTGGAGGGGTGGSGGGGGGIVQNCNTDPAGCTFTVYAHSNTVLYKIDFTTNALDVVGSFNVSDTMTDLAVAPDNTIYTVSKMNLYTASPTDGHATLVSSISTCGSDNVALSTTSDGKLWVGDGAGSFCEIDITAKPPTVKKIGMLGGTMALSGDLVGIGDGTLFGTALDTSQTTTSKNNVLVTIDPATGKISKQIGPTGFPQLYGVAYAQGKVFGFTHDGTGRVITIDPKTGVGTLYNTFNDPMTNKPISFSGAGVNSEVPPIQ